jgi:hypothetical protein
MGWWIALLALARAAALPASELDIATADRFAKLALACIDRAYPNKPEHTIDSAADVRSPQEFHPAFFGCFDWHSSVHGHWMLARLLRLYPELPSAGQIRARLDSHFSAESLAEETRYMDRASARSFERPYGGPGRSSWSRSSRAGTIRKAKSGGSAFARSRTRSCNAFRTTCQN